MISKNNLALRQQKSADKKQHFGLRKLSIGVASVLLTSSFFLINNTGTIHADTTESADTTTVSSGTSSNDSTKSSTSTTTAQAESSSTTTKTSDTEAESTSSSTDGNTSKENSTQSSTTDTSATNGSTQSTDNSTTRSTNTNQQSASSTTGTTAASVGISLYSENGTNDSLTASLSDGTTLTISRNTIGATGDTSNLTITLTVANFQDGDQYTLTIPKGDSYNINDPSGQALTISGTTTSSQTSDAYVITDRFTRSQTGSAGVTQTFTITPKNNYQAEDTPMSEIGDVLKTITLTKVAADGTTSSTSLSFTQIINPEMSPSFSRFMPSDTGYYLLPNTDYTYILNVRETSGVASGDSWSSNRVNSTVNSGTTITIPVPTGFTLDASQTALANAFTDETTITQPDGAGGNIIITVPSGSGSQGYQGMAGYKIVGYYAVDQPTTDTTVTASGNITIDQTITNADGTTSKIEKTLSPWTDTLAGSETTSTKAPRTSTDAATYNSSHTIVSTVDESTPIAYFGFSNPTATNLTDSTISIQIADGLNVDRITTPVDSVNLPGLTSYTYTATLSDGSTISGTVTAGDDVTT